ncbi:hypothetical protein N9L24_04350 [Candidatus Marinamargulisbacteria bacterium]|jgi:hypothetical protein|nr:hypothetical protein [Candidatus Marinamargulisbacteria bacterium]
MKLENASLLVWNCDKIQDLQEHYVEADEYIKKYGEAKNLRWL